MKENETFDEFYASLNNIVNSRFNLGGRIPKKEKSLVYLHKSTSILSELKSLNGSLDTQVKNLTSKLEKSSRRASELTIENETLKINVKNILDELEFSKFQLLLFSSGSIKLDNML